MASFKFYFLSALICGVLILGQAADVPTLPKVSTIDLTATSTEPTTPEPDTITPTPTTSSTESTNTTTTSTTPKTTTDSTTTTTTSTTPKTTTESTTTTTTSTTPKTTTSTTTTTTPKTTTSSTTESTTTTTTSTTPKTTTDSTTTTTTSTTPKTTTESTTTTTTSTTPKTTTSTTTTTTPKTTTSSTTESTTTTTTSTTPKTTTSTTTSTTPKPTTTTSTTTTTPPTTPPTPPAPPKPIGPPDQGLWAFKDGKNVTCVIVQFAGQLNVTYPKPNTSNHEFYHVLVNVPANASVGSGNCEGAEQWLTISWPSPTDKNNTLTVLFAKNGTTNTYQMMSLNASLDAAMFPNITSVDTLELHHGAEWQTPLASSYRCAAATELGMNEAAQTNVVAKLTLSRLQEEAFRTQPGTGFSAALDCAGRSKAVPIAVGCILAGIVVVLIAYLVARRRFAARGYLLHTNTESES